MVRQLAVRANERRDTAAHEVHLGRLGAVFHHLAALELFLRRAVDRVIGQELDRHIRSPQLTISSTVAASVAVAAP
jgi:hypothetical protein